MSWMTPMKNASRHCVAVRGRIAAGRVMVELTLDVGEKAARPDPEEIRLHPLDAKLLLHEDEPSQRVLGRAQAPRRLEADVDAGPLAIIAQGAKHDQAHRKRGVDVFLAGRCLDEIRARLHRD